MRLAVSRHQREGRTSVMQVQVNKTRQDSRTMYPYADIPRWDLAKVGNKMKQEREKANGSAKLPALPTKRQSPPSQAVKADLLKIMDLKGQLNLHTS